MMGNKILHELSTLRSQTIERFEHEHSITETRGILDDVEDLGHGHVSKAKIDVHADKTETREKPV